MLLLFHLSILSSATFRNDFNQILTFKFSREIGKIRCDIDWVVLRGKIKLVTQRVILIRVSHYFHYLFFKI